MYDLIIIGAGPAGMSAAVYAARAELDFIVIEAGAMAGGAVLTTYELSWIFTDRWNTALQQLFTARS